jgi:hypothetical protein
LPPTNVRLWDIKKYQEVKKIVYHGA